MGVDNIWLFEEDKGSGWLWKSLVEAKQCYYISLPISNRISCKFEVAPVVF